MAEVNVPQHVGIIMDGNGRWAKKRGLPRSFGHKQGAAVFKKTINCYQNSKILFLHKIKPFL